MGLAVWPSCKVLAGDPPIGETFARNVCRSGRDNLAVYDRQRSFSQVYVVRADGPAAFADLVAEMAGPRGGFGGLKMYRWAKRTGDWELSICVDRKPETDIKW